MERRKADLTQQIVAAVQELPEEQMAEVLDFASYLRARHDRYAPPRDFGEEFLHILDSGGKLQFAPGELDVILAEIDRARDTDRGDNG